MSPFLWRRNVFGCMLCTYTSCKFTHFRNHYKTHTNKREALKKARTPLNVKVDVTDLKCTVCHDNVTDVGTLIEHLIVEHEKNIREELGIGILPFLLVNGYKCPNCYLTFDNFLSLSNHSNEHYPHFVCSLCGKTFSNRSNLQNHLEVHDKPSEATCPRCDEVLPSKSRLRIHEREEHKLFPYKCPYCNVTFKLYTQRVRHINEYHDGNITYPCSLCPIVCASSNARSKHMRRLHTKEKRFLCSTCGKAFITAYELEGHMMKHQVCPERIYQCKMCMKCFTRQKVLKVHMSTHK